MGPELTMVLQDLQPQTTYRVTVTPEYKGGPGKPQQTDGTTKEGEHSFVLHLKLFMSDAPGASHHC